VTLTPSPAARYASGMSTDDVNLPFAKLVEIMHRLRAPGGCPWDHQQTHETLRPYLLEETYEVLEAIDAGDDTNLQEELGDLLLQVVFHAELAAERGQFDIGAVARGITDKLIRRHPHVFGDVEAVDADTVARNWQRLKDAEQKRPTTDTLADDVPKALPALARAQKVGSKLARHGLDWPDVDGVLTKIDEELAELRVAIGAGDAAGSHRELGDLVLTLSSLARHLDTSAELALHDATRRLLDRANRVAARARAQGTSLAELPAREREAHWDEVKKEI